MYVLLFYVIIPFFCKNLIYFGFVLFYVPSSKRQRVSKSVTRLTLPCFSGAEFVVEDVVADAEVAEEGDCDAISPISFLLFIVSSTLILRYSFLTNSFFNIESIKRSYVGRECVSVYGALYLRISQNGSLFNKKTRKQFLFKLLSALF